MLAEAIFSFLSIALFCVTTSWLFNDVIVKNYYCNKSKSFIKKQKQRIKKWQNITLFYIIQNNCSKETFLYLLIYWLNGLFTISFSIVSIFFCFNYCGRKIYDFYYSGFVFFCVLIVFIVCVKTKSWKK